MDELNPYAAPKAEVLTHVSAEEAERRAHISTESSIKTLGCLYLVGAVLCLGSLGMFATSYFSVRVTMPPGDELVKIAAMMVLLGAVGYGLRRLQFWAAVLATLVSGFFIILAVPMMPQSVVGIVIHVAIIATVLGQKGRRVMRPDYQQIIASTPEVRQRTSKWVWVLLVILLIVLAAVLGSLYFRQA
jgi:hypothetical protein